MADLVGLQERVRAATGADRWLDISIYLALVDGVLEEEERLRVPHYTESIDAALALVEKLGWCVHMLHMGPKGSQGGAAVDLCRPNQADVNFDGEGNTPALAILAALLSALSTLPPQEG